MINISFQLLSHKMFSPIIPSWIQSNHPFILTTPLISFHSKSPWIPDVKSKGQLSLHFTMTVNSTWHTSLFCQTRLPRTLLFFPSLPLFLSLSLISFPLYPTLPPCLPTLPSLSPFSPLFLSSLVLLPHELLPIFLAASFYLPYF